MAADSSVNRYVMRGHSSDQSASCVSSNVSNISSLSSFGAFASVMTSRTGFCAMPSGFILVSEIVYCYMIKCLLTHFKTRLRRQLPATPPFFQSFDNVAFPLPSLQRCRSSAPVSLSPLSLRRKCHSTRRSDH